MKDFIKEITGLIDPETRRGLLFLTGALILALSTAFFVSFLRPLSIVETVFGQLNLPNWGYGTILLLIEYILFVVISSDDTLYYSNSKKNRFVKAFQKDLPSLHVASRLNIDIDIAKNLWYNEFNKWSDEKHERHEDQKRSFKRGFSCRFVYYLWKTGLILLIISIIWLIVELFLFFQCASSIVNLESKITVTLLFLIFLLVLGITNRTNEQNLTGVWRRFNEINRKNCDWIDLNISIFQDALQKRTNNA